jgi:hypothetical protein
MSIQKISKSTIIVNNNAKNTTILTGEDIDTVITDTNAPTVLKYDGAEMAENTEIAQNSDQ